MQKVRVLVHKSDADTALDIIQRTGALEFCAVETSIVEQAMLEFPQADLLPRVQHAIRFLDPYAPKVGGWKALREGTGAQLTEREVARYLADTDAVQSIVADVEALQVEFTDLNEQVRVLDEKYHQLADWKQLPIKLDTLQTLRTVTFLLKNPQASEDRPLAEAVTVYCDTEAIPSLVTPVTPKTVALTLERTDTVQHLARQIADAQNAEIVTLPAGTETPDVEFVAVSERLAKVKGEVALLHDQAEHIAHTHFNTLREAAEIYIWQHDRYAVMHDTAATTRFTVALEGWLMAAQLPEIQAVFVQHNLAAIVVEQEPAEGEEPPVEIKNNALVQPFEVVTRLYGMPGYHDLDPTAFLAGFFFLFFGFCLTDAGYGLTLMLAGAFVLLFLKVDAGMKTFAKLMLWIGGATVLMGVLFGGYLGFDMSLLPEPLQKLQFFDPIGNPLPVFYFALGLGVLQTMVGLVLKIYSEAKQGRFLDGLLDRGPWLFMFTTGIVSLFTALGYLTFLTSAQLTKLMYVAAVLIVLTGMRSEGNIFQKIVSGLAGLYEGVGFFSDILSYSRLLALGLSTSALAYAINLIAAMVKDIPYVGIIVWLIVLAIGHLFTLAVNTLGAFVHSARLQFVEFFGKFINGTGKEFSPLARTHHYVTIKDD